MPDQKFQFCPLCGEKLEETEPEPPVGRPLTPSHSQTLWEAHTADGNSFGNATQESQAATPQRKWPLSLPWSIVVALVTLWTGLLALLAVYLWRGGHKIGAAVAAGAFILFAVAIISVLADGGGSRTSTPTTVAQVQPSHAAKTTPKKTRPVASKPASKAKAKKKPVATRPATTVAAPPATSADLREWGRQMATWSSTMGLALNGIAETASDPVGMMTRGSDTQIKAAVALAGLKTCSSGLDEISVPDEERVQAVMNQLYSACSEYEAAVDDYAQGLDEMDTVMMTRAVEELRRGTAITSAATEQVKAINASLN